MPLLVTPSQFRRRAELYRQISRLAEAGMGITKTLELLRRNPPARSFRAPLGRTIEYIQRGATLTEAMRQSGDWIPPFDIALIEAGENSGRLDASFRLLADYYDDRSRIARQIINDLLYPAFLFHFAVFIFPFASFFNSGDWLTYLKQTCGVLIPVYAVLAVLIYASQAGRAEAWRSFVEAVLHPVPVLGKARHYLALSRLAAALEALLSAGVTVIEAWGMAATASGSPALRRTVGGWKQHLLNGQTPAELVNRSRLFPETFANLYATGEVSGKLDESLRGLHRYYQEDGTNKIHLVAQWAPRFIYLAIVLIVAAKIVSFYAGYYRQVGEATRGF